MARRRLRLALAASLTVSLALARSASAADYASQGPLAVTTSDLPKGTGGADAAKLVVPQGNGPYPLIIASHGWSASDEQQVGWAQHFASYGFVVAAPTFPNALTPDAMKDAGIIQQLVTLLSSSNGTAADGKVDPTRLGLEGHSAGGLATTIAAATLHPAATVLFDPVDANNAGKTAYATLCSPVMGIFANPSSCNNNAGWSAFKTTSTGPQILFNVVGSTHCDGENNPRALCGSFCGGAADPQRQQEYSRYATAYFLAELSGDSAARAALDEAVLKADTAISEVVVTQTASCATTGPDGGAPPPPAGDDGGAPPLGGDVDAGAGGSPPHRGVDAGAGSGSNGGSGEDDLPPSTSAGCSASPGHVGSGGIAALVFGLGVALLRRRRHARG